MPNYNNGKVYKIVNNIDNMIYIGSKTTRLCNRMNVHRFKMRNNNTATLYKHMRKIGLENFTIVLIECYSCSNKEQLLRRERYILDLHNKQILLNKNRPNMTKIERLQQMRIWHTHNKNYHLQQTKKKKKNNKLQLKIYNINYNEHQKIMQELPFYRVPLTTFF